MACHVIIIIKTVPPFRGEKRSDPRSAFLKFQTIDDARMALQMLDGRAGPGGETLHVGLSRLPAVHSNRLWRWAQEREEDEENGGGGLEEEEGEEESFFEEDDEWGGLGFGTGEEGQNADDEERMEGGFVGRSR
jgi:hypothetical protein